MSQFDFPRINFHGRAVINPGTGNNSFHLPLSYYDPIRVKAFMPPRLYIMESCMIPGKSMEDFISAVPDDEEIQQDDFGKNYISLKPISDALTFKKWASTPLG